MPKVYVLGAGVDATDGIGMPLTNEILPKLTAYLETDEGKELDAKLRQIYPQLRFHFNKFVEKSIDNMAKNFSREVRNVINSVRVEMEGNAGLTEDEQKVGRLITLLMTKVSDMANGAQLDEETVQLIDEVFGHGIVVIDESIIDLNKVVFTTTFQTVIRQLLTRSLQEPNHRILRHLNKNFLDIEKLLAQYFLGFFTKNVYDIKIYSYISWMLWAYMLKCEQDILNSKTPEELVALPVYSQLEADSTVITFNYTTFAKMSIDIHHGREALYFHGSLLDYLDIKRREDFTHNLQDFNNLESLDFFENELRNNVSFEEDNLQYTIPSFMPPVSIKPVLTQKNIETWYQSSQRLQNADKIIIIGYSFNSSDEHFNGMLKSCRDKTVFIVDDNAESIKQMIREIYGIQPADYHQQQLQGHDSFVHGNITIIKAKAHEINYTIL